MKSKAIPFFGFLMACVAFAFACRQQKNTGKNDAALIRHVVSKPTTVVQILARLDTKGVVADLDLSHQQLKKLPDLSKYKIARLTISYNKLDTLPLNFLPKNLKKLICTHNKIRNFRSYQYIGAPNKYDNSDLNLEEIDLSHNRLRSFHYTVRHQRLHLKECQLKSANLSDNDLRYVSINCGNTRFLNLTNNKDLSNVFDFNILGIDTVLRDNIKNKLPLKMKVFDAPKNICN